MTDGSVVRLRPRSTLVNSVWSMVHAVSSIGIGFFLTPFLVGNLGETQYGIYVLLLSIGGVLGVLNIGLGEAAVRYVARYYGRSDPVGVNRVFRATLAITVSAGSFGCLVLLLAAPLLATVLAIQDTEMQLVTSLIRLTAVNFGLNLVNGTLMAIPRSVRRFDVDTLVHIIYSLFHASGAVVAVVVGLGVRGVMTWTAVSTLLMLLINAVVAKRLIPCLSFSLRVSKESLKEVLSYGVYSLLTSLLGSAWSQGDRVLLGILVSASSVAYLTVPYQVVFRALGVVSRLGTVLFARFSALGKDVSKIRELYSLASWMMLSVTVVVFAPVTVLIADILSLWVSPDFATESARIGRLLAGSTIIRGAFVAYEALFRGIGKPQYLTRLVILTSLTSLAANIVLIPRYGLMGAGYAYCITPIWGILTVIYTWRRVLGMRQAKLFIRGFCVPIMVGALSVGFGWYLRRFLPAQLSWLELGAMGLLLAAISGLLVIGGEFLLGGRNSHLQDVVAVLRQGLSERKWWPGWRSHRDAI